MKGLTFSLLLAMACSSVCQAQQGPEVPDSTMGPYARTAGGRPLFISFSAVVKESNKVLLQWDTDSTAEGDYFVIERSPDDSHYETIGALRATVGNGHYELTDMAPPNGSDFYRIRYSGQTGHLSYSRTMQLSLSGDVDFKFYPNPVDKLFIVRTQHSVDIQVVDAVGGVRLSKRLQPGIQVINVSSLERGVYILRVTDKESNRAVSQQLVKN